MEFPPLSVITIFLPFHMAMPKDFQSDDTEVDTEDELAGFFTQVQPKHVAVLAQSYLPFSADQYQQMLNEASYNTTGIAEEDA